MKQHRTNTRGFTLMEAMVGLACAMLVLLGAVGFAHYEIRTLGISRDNLEMTQAGRMSLDLLMDDLANAGAGVGYDETGLFMGLDLPDPSLTDGTFLRGTAQFDSTNRNVQINHLDVANPGTAGVFPTDDIGLMMAEGQYVTVTFWGATTAQICGPSGFAVGDTVLVRSADGISAKTVALTSVTPGAGCVAGTQCEQGCEDLVHTADPDASFNSGASANTTDFAGGSMAGGFNMVTWFVDATDPSRPQLRRLVGTCPAIDDTCGDVVADYVDTLQMRVFERVGTAWQDRTDTGIPLGSANPVRVDVELVLRAAHPDISGAGHPHARLVLEDKCLPGPDEPLPDPCPSAAQPNLMRRLVLRASVELKNAGHMRIN
jgi:Tfp pilus assembly protein PilW